MSRPAYLFAYTVLGALAVRGELIAQSSGDPSAISADAKLKRNHRACPSNEAETRIEAALKQPLRTPLAFAEVPLSGLFETISADYDIPIVFDLAALDSLAISPDTEVNVQLRNVSLRTAFKLVLRSPGLEDLTFLVDDQVLLITSEEEANSRLEVCVYRVDDLVRGGLDSDDLINIIVTSVNYDSWQLNQTGEGEIHAFTPGLLVVSQTQRVHQELAELLAAMRTVKAEIEADLPAGQKPLATRPVTRSFPIRGLPGADREQARAVVRDTIVRSVDWQADQGPDEQEPYLAVLSDRVIVRHLPKTVSRVERLLRTLDLVEQSRAEPIHMPSRGFGREGFGRGGFRGGGFGEGPFRGGGFSARP